MFAWFSRKGFGLGHGRRQRAFSLAGAVLLLAWPARAMEYSIEVLAALGGTYSRARAVNSDGQVVGEAYASGVAYERGFCSYQGAAEELATLGGVRSRAMAINEDGVIAGWAQDAAGKTRPVRWTESTPVPLPDSGLGGVAWGLNDAGDAVGQSTVMLGIYHAMLWTEGSSTAIDLGTLGGNYSVAYDINNLGQIVGSADDADGDEWAVLWQGNEITQLDGLPGATWSTARGINDLGQVILWGDSAAGASRAALWDDGVVLDLGTLGGEDSWAYGLNNLGQVVGWAELYEGNYHAFVYDGGDLVDLGTLGGMFSSAYGVNDAGVIVGASTDTLGRWYAVQWTPVPLPGGVWLLLAGWILTPRRR